MDLASLIEQYGYAAVLAGCLLEGETVLALAGLSAHRGYLALPWVIVIATFGGFIGDQFYFFLGRRFGPRLVSRYPQLEPGIARVDALLDRYGTWLILGVRFMYGLRTVGPIAIGMSRVHWLRFAALNLIGATLWAALIAGAGYLLGEALQRLLGELHRIEGIVFALIALAGLVAWLLRRRAG